MSTPIVRAPGGQVSGEPHLGLGGYHFLPTLYKVVYRTLDDLFCLVPLFTEYYFPVDRQLT